MHRRVPKYGLIKYLNSKEDLKYSPRFPSKFSIETNTRKNVQHPCSGPQVCLQLPRLRTGFTVHLLVFMYIFHRSLDSERHPTVTLEPAMKFPQVIRVEKETNIFVTVAKYVFHR